MRWCDSHDVGYVLGLALSSKLEAQAIDWTARAGRQFERTGQARRLLGSLGYAAKSSGRSRRVIAKAEHTARGPNPRFVVANVPGVNARSVAEHVFFVTMARLRRFRMMDRDLRQQGWLAGRDHAEKTHELQGRNQHQKHHRKCRKRFHGQAPFSSRDALIGPQLPLHLILRTQSSWPSKSGKKPRFLHRGLTAASRM